MNINLIKLKAVVYELRALREAVERLADAAEVDLSLRGYNMRPPRTDTSGPEPTMEYVDEEMDWARDNGLLKHLEKEE